MPYASTDDDDVPEPIATHAPAPDEVDGDEVRVPGTGLYDTVAVTHDGVVICMECASEAYVALATSDPYAIPYGGPVRRSAEWDCPGPSCDHCRRRIASVTVLHYDGVCQPEYCDQIDE
jgi:hypothetical protein